jgi:ligand-binding sensor domain-containing protein
VVFFRKPTSLLITSALIGLMVLPGANTATFAQSSLDVEPSELTPAYPASAPPPGRGESPDDDRRQEVDYRVNALQRDFTGNLWVGAWRGLSRIDPNTGKILARVSLPNTAIGAIAQDKVGRLWVGTYEGLKRVDLRTSEITAQNLFLPSKRVLSLVWH